MGARATSRRTPPGLAVERSLWAEGFDLVAGVDEVGRGAWAGPLTVVAAVLPREQVIDGVRDSKQLTERAREALFGRLSAWCETWSVGHASHDECDALGMSAAQQLAARRALDGLGCTPDRVLVDGRWDFVDDGRSLTITGGDATSLTIAAASVLAKVTRDRIMRAEAASFPGFDFEANKGYPCPRHRVSLAGQGPTSIHRRSWAFMDSLPWPALRREPAVTRRS